ncbi:hypothetical protein [Arthrobacter sp. UYCo732]|uniref:hypothetical protein n=1 Tax=Arthrobacter sp. UYCo732 TaxID=3156336 RepID=UPI003397354A
MSRGGFTAHLASLRGAAAVQEPPATAAEPLPLRATSCDVVLGHQDKITAGVPGCICGLTYPEDSFAYWAVRHAQHVADEVVSHTLAAAVAAIRAGSENYDHPDRWGAKGCDSQTAIDAITNLLRRGNEPDRTKEATTA